MPPEGWDAGHAVGAVLSRPFQGSVWRTHWREVHATDWSLSLQTSGRYHRGLDLFPGDQAWPAIYTSLAPEVALWEMVRRSAARSLAFLRNNVLTELEIDLDQILDLSDSAVLGLSLEELTGSDYRVCQALAAEAVSRGYQGLLAPSAVLPGLNLVIFPVNLDGPLPVRVIRSMELPLETITQERLDRERQ